jgi:hypothetical protein
MLMGGGEIREERAEVGYKFTIVLDTRTYVKDKWTIY